jgi:septal ring factor EnvC (AmiA/AmiB activator)
VVRVARGLSPAFFAIGLGFIGAALPRAVAAPEKPPVDAQTTQLDALRAQCVTTARAVQQRERTIGALDLAVGIMQRGVDAKNREIEQSRKQQEALLGALERLARMPAEAQAIAPQGPVDRLRSGILIAAAVPALAAQARELTGQLTALTMVHNQLDTRRKDVDEARAALAKGRDTLAELITKRNALNGQLLRDDVKPAASAQLGEQASDLFDLIKRADAALDQRDKDRLIQLHITQPIRVKGPQPVLDPTRPKDLRGLDAPRVEMVWPISGEPTHRFGEADSTGRPSQGLVLEGVPGGLVVAPFDGRVDYIGRFRDYGLILIIRHGGGYHSLLVGLGHVNVTTGQWLLAGEPIGTLPEADDKNTSANFYLELRRDGRPVDPQSRLTSRDQKTEDTRVSE